MPSKAAQVVWAKRNSKYLSLQHANRRERIKKEMVAAFGGACVCCGNTNFIVLALDHVDDNGAEFRRNNKRLAGFKLYAKLRREGWPREGLQLLCHNCNFEKEYKRRKAAVIEKAAPLEAPKKYITSSETKLKLSLALKGKPKPRRK